MAFLNALSIAIKPPNSLFLPNLSTEWDRALFIFLCCRNILFLHALHICPCLDIVGHVRTFLVAHRDHRILRLLKILQAATSNSRTLIASLYRLSQLHSGTKTIGHSMASTRDPQKAKHQTWIFVPTHKRKGHRLPASVFQVARAVVEDAMWFPRGFPACRDEILDRIKAHSELPNTDIITATFLKDLHTSLRSPVYERQPWSYAKYEGESDEESSSEDEEVLTSGSTTTGSPGNQIEEEAESEELPPGGDDKVSETSQVAEEYASDHQDDDEGNTTSSFSEPSIPSFESSEDDGSDVQGHEKPSMTDLPLTITRPLNRRLQYLLVIRQYLGLKMAWLRLILEGRKHEHEKYKRKLSLLRRSIQPDRTNCDAQEEGEHTENSPRSYSAEPVAPVQSFPPLIQVADNSDHQVSKSAHIPFTQVVESQTALAGQGTLKRKCSINSLFSSSESEEE